MSTGTYRELFRRVIYTEWFFFGLMAIGLFILRRRPELSRAYSAWGYPYLPALFVVSSFAIVLNQIVSSPWQSAMGLGLVLTGLPVYYLWAREGRRKERGT